MWFDRNRSRERRDRSTELRLLTNVRLSCLTHLRALSQPIHLRHRFFSFIPSRIARNKSSSLSFLLPSYLIVVFLSLNHSLIFFFHIKAFHIVSYSLIFIFYTLIISLIFFKQSFLLQHPSPLSRPSPSLPASHQHRLQANDEVAKSCPLLDQRPSNVLPFDVLHRVVPVLHVLQRQFELLLQVRREAHQA